MVQNCYCLPLFIFQNVHEMNELEDIPHSILGAAYTVHPSSIATFEIASSDTAFCVSSLRSYPDLVLLSFSHLCLYFTFKMRLGSSAVLRRGLHDLIVTLNSS